MHHLHAQILQNAVLVAVTRYTTTLNRRLLYQPVFHKLSGLETEKPASTLTTASESEKSTASASSSFLASLALLRAAQSTQNAS